jgi:hypothetical protein
VPGTGQQVAAEFLTALRSALAARQVVVLPYSDPDSVALVRAGMETRLSSLVTLGRTVASRVLRLPLSTGPGVQGLITSVARPENGLVDDQTLAFLSTHGLSAALLAPQTLQHKGGPVGAATIDESRLGGAAVTTAITDAAVGANVQELLAKGNAAGAPVRLNTVAALLAEGSFDGTGTPIVVAPDNRWTANAAGLRTLSGLFATLSGGGVVAGVSLTSIAAAAHSPASVAYPDSGRTAELSQQYLRQVNRESGRISTLRQSLVWARGTDALRPEDLLDPLAAGLDSTTSAAVRYDRSVAQSILSTTDATLNSLWNGVSIVSSPSYTLAASTAPLIITVRNELPYGVRVRVMIRNAASVGMTATDPGVLSVLAGRSQQFKISTNVVKAGRFQVEAVLLAADGTQLSQSLITVTSSAYGTLTIVLIAVAGAALMLMVVIRIAQRLRGTGRWGPDHDDEDQDQDQDRTEPDPDSILASANRPDPPIVHPGSSATGGRT